MPVNKNGTPANLIASHPRNQNAIKHGAFSKPLRETRVSEIVEELKTTYKVNQEPALSAFRDLAGLSFMSEQLNQELETRGVVPRNNRERSLLDLRLRVSRQYQRSRETMLAAVRETLFLFPPRLRDEAREPAKGEPQPAPRAHQETGSVTIQGDDAFLRQLMVRRAQDEAIAAARALDASKKQTEPDGSGKGGSEKVGGAPGSKTGTTATKAKTPVVDRRERRSDP